MSVSHTPTPWAVNEEMNSIYAEDHSVVSIAACGFSEPGQGWSGTDYSTKAHQVANAEFIVRAANSHDDLVEAVKAQHRAIDSLMARLISIDPTFCPTKSEAWPAVLQGQNALNKAENP